MTGFYSWLNNKLLSEMIIDFGKHKGKDTSEVDTAYLKWAKDNVTRPDNPKWVPKWEALMSAINDELANRQSSNSPIVTPRKEIKSTPPPFLSPPKKASSFKEYWAVGVAKKLLGAIKSGEYVVLHNLDDIQKNPNTDWECIAIDGLKATIASTDRKESVESIKDEKNNAILFPNFEAALKHAKKLSEENKPTDNPENIEKQQPESTEKTIDSDLLYPKKKFKLLPEQKAIDERFAEGIGNSNSHIMINALAGTGKSTILKHIAWKYGNPKQKWLYLVYNTKNKLEASEPGEFPSFVDIKTSNGFLGEVLGHRNNLSRITQTERTVKIPGAHQNDKIEKIKELVASPGFQNLLTRLKVDGDIKRVRESDQKGVGSLLKSIKYSFGKTVIRFADLAKSFATNISDPKQVEDKFKIIFDKYDHDTSLDNVKERISQFDGYYRTKMLRGLHDALGYDFMDKDYTEEIIDAVKWLLKESMPGVSKHVIKKQNSDYDLGKYRDFKDDMWYTATHADQIHWPKYDIVLADEVQDFNEAQHIMLRKLAEQGARIVAVGDPRQSIYKFNGAHSESFNELQDVLKNMAGKDITSQLTYNMRSRKEILDFANEHTHVKDLKAGLEYPDKGETSHSELSYSDTFSKLKEDYKKNGNKFKETNALIARTNEPLANAALKLLANGLPFVILGKDLANDINDHIRMILNFNKNSLNGESDVGDLMRALNEHKAKEQDSHGYDNRKTAYLKQLDEITEAIKAAGSEFTNSGTDTAHTIANFQSWLTKQLKGLDVESNEKDYKEYKEKMKNNPVVLTTSHKSKGMEYDHVYILRNDLFPHPIAKASGRKDDLEQEENARYIAYTRARKGLHILDLEGQPGYKK